jgi:hypothetical protein
MSIFQAKTSHDQLSDNLILYSPYLFGLHIFRYGRNGQVQSPSIADAKIARQKLLMYHSPLTMSIRCLQDERFSLAISMAYSSSLTPLFSLQHISHIFEPLYIFTLTADATESIHRPFFAVWLRQKFHTPIQSFYRYSIIE